jgi:micrococcal nuclease
VVACALQTLPGTAAWSQEPARSRSLPAAVVKVVSGDTIHVFVNGDIERVRYIGVTAPEPGDSRPESGEPLGREALRFNRGLTNAKNVRLELDVQERDPEGRLLAYVWLGDVMANAEMIGHGFGQVVTGGPNVRHQDTLLRRQDQARAAKLGIWRLAGPAAPPARGTPAAAPPKTAPKTGGPAR